MNQDEYNQKPMTSPCVICGKYGHWKNAHLPDGSLPAHVKAADKPENGHYHSSSDEQGSCKSNDQVPNKQISGNKEKKTVVFNCAMVTDIANALISNSTAPRRKQNVKAVIRSKT